FDLCSAETLPQIDDRDDLATQVDDTLDELGSLRNLRYFRHAHNFMHQRDGNSVGLVPNPEANDMEVFRHQKPPLDTSHCIRGLVLVGAIPVAVCISVT